jgi:hypothetical protein
MSYFFAHVTRKVSPSRQRGSPRESNRSGKPTTREADIETATPGHQITRLAVIFVHLFSHNMRSLKYERKSTALREALRGKADHALTPAEQTLMTEWLDRSADRRLDAVKINRPSTCTIATRCSLPAPP